MRRWVALLWFVTAFVACGGTPSPQPSPSPSPVPSPSPTPSPTPTPTPSPEPPGDRITGTERIGWDQQARSLGELTSFRYAIYVDGSRSELPDASCGNSAGPSGYLCTARLPAMSLGPHTLEIVAYVTDGTVFESTRSVSLRVVVAAAAKEPEELSSGTVHTTSDGIRLRLDVVAEGLQAPADIAFLPDGRTLVAERGGRVRLLSEVGLAPQPALMLDDALPAVAGGAFSLAVDPDFERTHFVFALYAAQLPAGGPVFRLVRFREANDTLVERVFLLPDVPSSGRGGSAILRFGPDAKLYAAIDDGGNERSPKDLASFNGKVLRLNVDGTTPRDQPAATPVYSVGYRSPRGLGWDRAHGLFWVVDGVLPRSRIRGRQAGGRTVEIDLPVTDRVASLAVYEADLIAPFRHDLLMGGADSGSVLRMRLDTRDLGRVVAMERLLEGLGAVNALAVGPDGAIYLCTETLLARLAP